MTGEDHDGQKRESKWFAGMLCEYIKKINYADARENTERKQNE